jgi:hypothetical protein
MVKRSIAASFGNALLVVAAFAFAAYQLIFIVTEGKIIGVNCSRCRDAHFLLISYNEQPRAFLGFAFFSFFIPAVFLVYAARKLIGLASRN